MTASGPTLARFGTPVELPATPGAPASDASPPASDPPREALNASTRDLEHRQVAWLAERQRFHGFAANKGKERKVPTNEEAP